MCVLRAMIVAVCMMLAVVADSTVANPCKYNPPPTMGAYSPAFTLAGEVLTPKTFDEAALRQYPSTKVNVVYGAGSGIESGSFVGVLLWDLINEAGLVLDPARKNDRLRKYVVV